MEDLNWTCHVCGERRPDQLISVYSEKHFIGEIPLIYNVRYCNDRKSCSAHAPKIVAHWAQRAE